MRTSREESTSTWSPRCTRKSTLPASTSFERCVQRSEWGEINKSVINILLQLITPTVRVSAGSTGKVQKLPVIDPLQPLTSTLYLVPGFNSLNSNTLGRLASTSFCNFFMCKRPRLTGWFSSLLPGVSCRCKKLCCFSNLAWFSSMTSVSDPLASISTRMRAVVVVTLPITGPTITWGCGPGIRKFLEVDVPYILLMALRNEIRACRFTDFHLDGPTSVELPLVTSDVVSIWFQKKDRWEDPSLGVWARVNFEADAQDWSLIKIYKLLKHTT